MTGAPAKDRATGAAPDGAARGAPRPAAGRPGEDGPGAGRPAGDWYVAHTHPRAEARARAHLLRQGFGVYLPQFLKRRRHARRVEEVAAPLFPRYLFVRFDPAKARWRAIRSTVGVQALVCHGETPAPVPEGIVEAIRAREDERGFVRLGALAQLRPGQKVRIAAGALADQIGLLERLDDRERVSVLLDLLGRRVRVRLPLDSVVAAVP